MHPLPVVVELDVLEDILPRFVPRPVRPSRHQLPLQGLEEGLGERVVPRVAGPRHRLGYPVGLQAALERAGRVLDALVVMEHEAEVGRGGSSRPAACSSASTASFSVMRSDVDQPTALRCHASMTTARYSQPSEVPM